MQVIAGVVLLEQFLGIAWIARRFVEIDDAIVGLARAHPLVESLALGLANFGVIRRAPERRKGGSVDLEPARARLVDELFVTRDQIFSGRRRVLARISDVVDPFEDDDMRRTRVR